MLTGFPGSLADATPATMPPMSEHGTITLTRDVEAAQIPSGAPILLAQGTEVLITQALGGSYTVHVSHAGLVRVRSQDADALGREAAPVSASDGPFSEDAVWAQLRECYDPEIPVNVVDLGLVYGVEFTEDPSGQGKRVAIQLTLTAPGCGMGPTLAHDAEQRVLSVPGVVSATVELVWDPPWSPERISAAGREKLGMV